MNTDAAPGAGKGIAVVIGVAAIALGAGLWFGSQFKQPAGPARLELERATVVGPSTHDVPEFALVDHLGEPFTPARLHGTWSLMFFGYTFCPDVCPVTLNAVAQGLKALTPEVRREIGNVLFVSVDPARDTAPRLRDYVGYFDSSFIGVTGNEAELARFARGFGALFIKPKETDGDYLVDHSASLILVGPAGRLYAVLSAPHEPALIARNLSAIISNSPPPARQG